MFAYAAMTPSVEFVNGMSIPIIGLGTYDMTDDQSVMSRVLTDAIDVGYRHIDTAYIYQNEEIIGRSLTQ
ncbi:unnamed protein product, partial [Medioppia subpectinata]